MRPEPESDKTTKIEEHDHRSRETVPKSGDQNQRSGHERSGSHVTRRYKMLPQATQEVFADHSVVHFAVTAHPTAEWMAQQMREAFPWESAPRYLLCDRDRIFGKEFVDQVKAMGVKQVLSAPRSPWQRAYVERVIGTIRRECPDHMIIFNERCLYWHLKSFLDYYHRSRTHLALQKDSPEPRPIQAPDAGRIIAIPEVGGLHHRYERRAT